MTIDMRDAGYLIGILRTISENTPEIDVYELTERNELAGRPWPNDYRGMKAKDEGERLFSLLKVLGWMEKASLGAVRLTETGRLVLSMVDLNRAEDALDRAPPLVAAIAELGRLVEAWAFDADTYPQMPRGRVGPALTFATAHTGVRLAKSTGKLCALVEPLGHADRARVQKDDQTEIARQTAYTVINALQMARLAGCKPEDVARHVHAWHQSCTSESESP